MMHRVYLIPGFFGFANLGDFYYFGHLYDLLADLFARRGQECALVRVRTRPTASIRQRARVLAETIAASAREDDGPIHLVGHSTGGLDARLLLSPGVALGEGSEFGFSLDRVQSLIAVATPHHGTPLASLFTGLQGQNLLRLLSLVTLYVLRFGQLPLGAVLRFGTLLLRTGGWVGLRQSLFDELFVQLLSDFSPERRQQVGAFLHDVSSDQALVLQLTPDAMDLFNASAVDRPGVAYGSLLTRGRKPGLGARRTLGLAPQAQLTHSLYSLLHRQVRRMPARLAPHPDEQQRLRLERDLDALPERRDNDGIVPTLSQLWGRLLGAAEADHLDVIGHFGDSGHAPQHVDWLASGSAFDHQRFEALWDEAVDFMLNAA